ncbi:acetyltransferase [Actinoplanes sp. SE50]|uniref:GNAT family N-acetyltransferase n=1 Tax=unclassified Actinoplanes TaxID=2626549 RepID=UPI00023EC62E|nr:MULTISPECIES: GNAT family N-acetyltransferase [unclassified Actinoplanes]AEV84690.1 GCN5-related N-acetyltransferase [Actinoplanes sp. SE50/110]ATO83082.1 acetyltransferase [Actinoplanes sp. SE50]SLM00489.1 acetyltransferase [Actinoplanes sp. SE50/110]
MHSAGWHLTEDVDHFLVHAGDFLRSRPALHTMPLTRIETFRTRTADRAGAVFGWLESGGGVRAFFYRLRPFGLLTLTGVSREQSDTLAAELAARGDSLNAVHAEHDTATAFAEAWNRHTGADPLLVARTPLYRLDRLTPPRRPAEGHGRTADARDHEHVVRWCREFCAAVGEDRSIQMIDVGDWAASRFGDKHYTFWETPDGTAVSMAGWTSMVCGMVRVDPVWTPAHYRGRGYAGAVTVEVSRAALTAGATDVVLFADATNPTSNALYQRIGYVPVADFALYRLPRTAA